MTYLLEKRRNSLSDKGYLSTHHVEKSNSFQDPRGAKESTIFCVARYGDMPALYFFRRDNDNDDNNGQKAPSANDDDYHSY